MALNPWSSFCYTGHMHQETIAHGFVDSHFHLAILESKNVDMGVLAKKLTASGVSAGIDIAVGLEDLEERKNRLKVFPGFGYSIGLYPSYADRDDMDAELHRLRQVVAEHARDPRFVAMGEMGLDYHWNYGSPELQRYILQSQLDIAAESGLPVVIHNRQADDDLFKILRGSESRGIMHCFSSNAEQMRKFTELGMYISFAGNLTFKNAHDIRQAAAEVPLDRVLFETDSPFLSPVPLRGKVNDPTHVRYVYDFFAELRGLESKELKDQVRRNFNRAIPRYEAIAG